VYVACVFRGRQRGIDVHGHCDRGRVGCGMGQCGDAVGKGYHPQARAHAFTAADYPPAAVDDCTSNFCECDIALRIAGIITTKRRECKARPGMMCIVRVPEGSAKSSRVHV
jgi:hypothetical protein